LGLDERIASLSPAMQAEVADFVEYLHQKQEKQSALKSIQSVKELKGLGKEVWKEVDPDQYVNELRGSLV